MTVVDTVDGAVGVRDPEHPGLLWFPPDVKLKYLTPGDCFLWGVTEQSYYLVLEMAIPVRVLCWSVKASNVVDFTLMDRRVTPVMESEFLNADMSGRQRIGLRVFASRARRGVPQDG